MRWRTDRQNDGRDFKSEGKSNEVEKTLKVKSVVWPFVKGLGEWRKEKNMHLLHKY